MRTLYFDHAATTPVSREVLEEMLPYFEIQYGMHQQCILLGDNLKEQ